MDVRIRVCMSSLAKRWAAMRLARTIKKQLGLHVPVEAGYHGQCEDNKGYLEVHVDGEVLPLTAYLGSGDKAVAEYVLDELRRRGQGPPGGALVLSGHHR